MKQFFSSFAILACALTGSAAALTPPNCRAAATPPSLREYRVDFGNSIVEFSIKFGFTRVKGRFTAADGTILYDARSPANSSITIIIDSKSLDTGWPHRDEHLRTSDFFDTEKYPTIEFRSRRLWQAQRGWMAEGDLTMHGVTKRITIPFRLLQPPTRDPQSLWLLMNVAGEVRLARADFGITGGSTFNSWFDKARAATMGDSVEVTMEVEGYLPDATSQRSPRVQEWLDSIKVSGAQSQITRFGELIKTKKPAEAAAYLHAAGLMIRGLIGDCRVPDAVTFAKGIAALYPQAHEAALLNGFVLTMAGNPRAAAAEFAKAKRTFRAPVRDPNEKFPQVDAIWWYMDQLTLTALEWGYAEQAVPLASSLADLYPATARAHTTYALTLASVKRSTEAAAAYERALKVDPRETRALEWQRRLR